MWVPHLSRDATLLPLVYSSILLLLGSLAGIKCLIVQSTQAPLANLQDGQQNYQPDRSNSSLGEEVIKSIWDDQERPVRQRCESVAAGFLLGDSTDLRLNMSNPIDRNLSQILDRDGPDMRPSRDFRDFKDISMAVAKRAWWLLHEHTRLAVSDRVDLSIGALTRHLVEAKASSQCVKSFEKLFVHAKQMDSWAIKLLNSWGSFPMSAIYEGTYGSVGSFHTCVDIEENDFIGHAHYCSVAFRPLMPSQKEYELILRKEPAELRQMFEKLRYDRESHQPISSTLNNNNYQVKNNTSHSHAASLQTPKPDGARPNSRSSSADAFTDILEHAQYHHILYYKVGTCWPIACSPFDVRRVTKLFARKSILLNGPVKCYSKHVDDYERPDSVNDDDDDDNKDDDVRGTNWHDPMASANTRGRASGHGNVVSQTTILINGNNTNGPRKPSKNITSKGKLILSVWDKNNGIFIWKPHFTREQKIAFSIVLAVTGFIGLMTLIDICFVRLPPLYGKFILSLKGLPLDFYGNSQVDRMGCRVGENNFSLHNFAGHRKHTRHEGQFLRISTNVTEVPPDAFHPATLVEGQTTTDLVNEDELVLDDELPPKQQSNQIFYNLFWSLIDDCSAITNLNSFFHVSEGQLRNDILCLNGIRCITMIWIIMTHTIMFNDWSAFARTREIEIALNSMLMQPLFNASYLVDTFFLMSGLLSAYTAFKHCQGKMEKFNSLAFILGRWLRLTPQIFLISMVFIFFPTLSYGPHWYPIVGEFSENCVNNWWINVLHLQAFYKQEEMCNFVTWWISIDFFYHFFALAVIWIILISGHKLGVTSMGLIVGSAITWQSYHHYSSGLPPNMFSSIPLSGAMWTNMTLGFFWTPYTHSVPFFLGFYIGYLMALKRKLIVRLFNTRRALIGWIVAAGLLGSQSYSTYWWVTGQAEYSRAASTLFIGVAPFVWAGSLCWIILACEHGYGGFVNKVLSWKVFIVLGKSSYLIYLSHFMILFLFFANQNVFLEPTPLDMTYFVVGNIFLSTLLGIILCSVYEIPWLKMHRRLMKFV